MRSFRFRHTRIYTRIKTRGCARDTDRNRLTKGPIILNETLVKLHRFGQHVCDDKHASTNDGGGLNEPSSRSLEKRYRHTHTHTAPPLDTTLNPVSFRFRRAEPNNNNNKNNNNINCRSMQLTETKKRPQQPKPIWRRYARVPSG